MKIPFIGASYRLILYTWCVYSFAKVSLNEPLTTEMLRDSPTTSTVVPVTPTGTVNVLVPKAWPIPIPAKMYANPLCVLSIVSVLLLNVYR